MRDDRPWRAQRADNRAGSYTSPQRLAIWGGSAGGILVGRAMTERPDLFAVVLPQGGALDMVRAEVTPNGVPNIPEFGTRTTEAGFRALLAMSTYHQIRDGVKYPAVLTHGVNDPRRGVDNTKTAARLLAASTSGSRCCGGLRRRPRHRQHQAAVLRSEPMCFRSPWQNGREGLSTALSGWPEVHVGESNNCACVVRNVHDVALERQQRDPL
jgi:hypothetical protein